MQVNLINRSLRQVTITAAAAAAVMSIAASSASAATTAPASTAVPAAVAHAVTSSATTAKGTKAPKVRQPGGCNNYFFCEYNNGNGTNLCFQSRNDVPNWTSACNHHNDGEYNRGGNAVYMYSHPNYTGCYYLLYSGHYLLDNKSGDYFQGAGDACTDQNLWDDLASDKFV